MNTYKSVATNGDISDIAKDYGAYIAGIDFYIENTTSEMVCDIHDEAIYINSQYSSSTVLFISTILCHEMVHQYDAWYGEYTELIRDEHLNHKEYDPHTTQTFLFLSDYISKLGLDVMQKVKGIKYEELNKRIVRRARDLVESQIDLKKYTKLFSITTFARFGENDASK